MAARTSEILLNMIFILNGNVKRTILAGYSVAFSTLDKSQFAGQFAGTLRKTDFFFDAIRFTIMNGSM